MSEYFWKLPSKRTFPDYFKMIKNPISLYQIRTKIKVRKLAKITLLDKSAVKNFWNIIYNFGKFL